MKMIAAILAALLIAAPARADADHDRARRALEEGRVLPLKDILARAEAIQPGQLIEAELEDDRGTLVYEIKMLAGDGRVVKLIYDAATGTLLRTKGKEVRR